MKIFENKSLNSLTSIKLGGSCTAPITFTESELDKVFNELVLDSAYIMFVLGTNIMAQDLFHNYFILQFEKHKDIVIL